MKFIVSSSALLKQLQHISGVISNNTVLPILEDFLFEIEKDKLTVVATDLETVMKVHLDVTSKDSGKFCIPAKILLDSLKKLFSTSKDVTAAKATELKEAAVSKGADLKEVAAKFDKVYTSEAATQINEAKQQYQMTETFSYGLQPLLDMHLSTDFSAQNGLVDASNPIYSKILVGIAVFILIIACINFVNLTVARSLKRAKEIGIRKVIGGERKQLTAQFLGESFVLSFFAFVLAILLVIVVLPFLHS